MKQWFSHLHLFLFLTKWTIIQYDIFTQHVSYTVLGQWENGEYTNWYSCAHESQECAIQLVVHNLQHTTYNRLWCLNLEYYIAIVWDSQFSRQTKMYTSFIESNQINEKQKIIINNCELKEKLLLNWHSYIHTIIVYNWPDQYTNTQLEQKI